MIRVGRAARYCRYIDIFLIPTTLSRLKDTGELKNESSLIDATLTSDIDDSIKRRASSGCVNYLEYRKTYYFVSNLES